MFIYIVYRDGVERTFAVKKDAEVYAIAIGGQVRREVIL